MSQLVDRIPDLTSPECPRSRGADPQATSTLHSSLPTPHSSLLTPHSSLLTPHSSLPTPEPRQAPEAVRQRRQAEVGQRGLRAR